MPPRSSSAGRTIKGSINSEYVSNAKPIDEMMQISHLTKVNGGFPEAETFAVVIKSPGKGRVGTETCWSEAGRKVAALDQQSSAPILKNGPALCDAAGAKMGRRARHCELLVICTGSAPRLLSEIDRGAPTSGGRMLIFCH